MNKYICLRVNTQKQLHGHRICIPVILIEATGLPSKVAAPNYAPTNSIQKNLLLHNPKQLVPIIDKFIKWLLATRHDSEYIMCMNSFNAHNNPVTWVLIHYPFIGPKRLRILSWGTHWQAVEPGFGPRWHDFRALTPYTTLPDCSPSDGLTTVSSGCFNLYFSYC